MRLQAGRCCWAGRRKLEKSCSTQICFGETVGLDMVSSPKALTRDRCIMRWSIEIDRMLLFLK